MRERMRELVTRLRGRLRLWYYDEPEPAQLDVWRAIVKQQLSAVDRPRRRAPLVLLPRRRL
jgi:hypothetical protein